MVVDVVGDVVVVLVLVVGEVVVVDVVGEVVVVVVGDVVVVVDVVDVVGEVVEAKNRNVKASFMSL